MERSSDILLLVAELLGYLPAIALDGDEAERKRMEVLRQEEDLDVQDFDATCEDLLAMLRPLLFIFLPAYASLMRRNCSYNLRSNLEEEIPHPTQAGLEPAANEVDMERAFRALKLVCVALKDNLLKGIFLWSEHYFDAELRAAMLVASFHKLRSVSAFEAYQSHLAERRMRRKLLLTATHLVHLACKHLWGELHSLTPESFERRSIRTLSLSCEAVENSVKEMGRHSPILPTSSNEEHKLRLSSCCTFCGRRLLLDLSKVQCRCEVASACSVMCDAAHTDYHEAICRKNDGLAWEAENPDIMEDRFLRMSVEDFLEAKATLPFSFRSEMERMGIPTEEAARQWQNHVSELYDDISRAKASVYQFSDAMDVCIKVGGKRELIRALVGRGKAKTGSKTCGSGGDKRIKVDKPFGTKVCSVPDEDSVELLASKSDVEFSAEDEYGADYVRKCVRGETETDMSEEKRRHLEEAIAALTLRFEP